ncbi:MAG: antibiotic biosynthesis monooxygenase [Defluviitaleaceae bacterium]|nr:antibiotic biosynthesis monooxygenase [Defluviitaleaceae bacterium]
MVIVHAFIEVKDGMAQKFTEAAGKCVAETRKEPGNKFYTLYADSENPLKFVIVEEWDDKAALDEHMKLPHFLELGENIKDLVASTSVKIFEAKAL